MGKTISDCINRLIILTERGEMNKDIHISNETKNYVIYYKRFLEKIKRYYPETKGIPEMINYLP